MSGSLRPGSRVAALEPIRSKAMRVCAFFLIACTAGVASASAQSLADVARTENDRRQTVKDAGGKTWTNQDLKPVPAAPADAAAPATDSTEPAAAVTDADGAASPGKDDDVAQADAKDVKPDAKPELRDQAYWGRRMAELRTQLERDETFRDALQTRVDALTSDFVNRDDPAQRGRIAMDRQKALAELDRVKKTIEQGRRAIPDLEEEARREGVPAGWLR